MLKCPIKDPVLPSDVYLYLLLLCGWYVHWFWTSESCECLKLLVQLFTESERFFSSLYCLWILFSLFSLLLSTKATKKQNILFMVVAVSWGVICIRIFWGTVDVHWKSLFIRVICSETDIKPNIEGQS